LENLAGAQSSFPTYRENDLEIMSLHPRLPDGGLQIFPNAP
jgi:hypothetical protein